MHYFDYNSQDHAFGRGEREKSDRSNQVRCGETMLDIFSTLDTKRKGDSEGKRHQKSISITKEDECPSTLVPVVPSNRRYTPTHHLLDGTTEVADPSPSSGVLSAPPRLAASRLPPC